MVVLKLAHNNFKRFLREKNAVFIYILLPVILFGAIMLFTGNTGSKISVYVADEDKSFLSSQYMTYLQEQDQYRIVPITITDQEDQVSEDEHIYTISHLQQQIQNMNISMYIIIEKGFEEGFYKDQDVNIQLYGLQKSDTLQTLGQMNNHYFSNMRGLYIGSGKDPDKLQDLTEAFNKKEVKLTSQYISENNNPDNISFALGILIYFILLTSIKISHLAVEDRLEGVYRRLLSMPLKAKHYIGGYLISTSSLVLIQILLSIAVMVILGDALTIPILDIVMTLLLFALCGIAISFFIIAVVKKVTVVEILTNVVVMFSSMVAGIFWPVDMMPAFMQRLARLFPQYWAHDIIKALFYGESLWNKQLNISILGIITIVFFVMASYWMGAKKEA
ncbi:ABC transporter permease [Vallitalea pronyensis]|uniref:ABC transporter permease n=1 Tax=Vallitalea pronyensis TaxID=1348613 RepID=A0A8J8MPG9_9FIRM|nr:ABC transporter permease [Vallitalea pronyensis]QUI25530.1 ABC transporter permease [Vallitalea pronyensis]